MTTPKAIARPFVLTETDVSDDESTAVLGDAVVAEPEVDVISVVGPGAAGCLQGVLTNDLEGAGDGGFIYGAVLTAKGMIICDMWVARNGGIVYLATPMSGTSKLLEVFERYFPPRLARPSTRSDELTILRISGPRSLEIANRAGIAIPSPGRGANTVVGEAACFVARPTEPADFGLQIQLAREHAAQVQGRLRAAGAVEAGPHALELARILAGWPKLGAEIDHKTLPQEVRYDQINGVSYTKGCYTGQETVARLHFRGHANKGLLGVLWDGTPDPMEPSIVQGEKPIGRVTSIAWLSSIEQHIGLAIIRREANLERDVIAANAPAEIANLPFALHP